MKSGKPKNDFFDLFISEELGADGEGLTKF